MFNTTYIPLQAIKQLHSATFVLSLGRSGPVCIPEWSVLSGHPTPNVHLYIYDPVSQLLLSDSVDRLQPDTVLDKVLVRSEGCFVVWIQLPTWHFWDCGRIKSEFSVPDILGFSVWQESQLVSILIVNTDNVYQRSITLSYWLEHLLVLTRKWESKQSKGFGVNLRLLSPKMIWGKLQVKSRPCQVGWLQTFNATWMTSGKMYFTYAQDKRISMTNHGCLTIGEFPCELCWGSHSKTTY